MLSLINRETRMRNFLGNNSIRGPNISETFGFRSSTNIYQKQLLLQDSYRIWNHSYIGYCFILQYKVISFKYQFLKIFEPSITRTIHSWCAWINISSINENKINLIHKTKEKCRSFSGGMKNDGFRNFPVNVVVRELSWFMQQQNSNILADKQNSESWLWSFAVLRNPFR